jgi:hypothetical protein
MQDAWIFADKIFKAITRSADEGLVDILDLGIEIGDDDVLRALLDGQ